MGQWVRGSQGTGVLQARGAACSGDAVGSGMLWGTVGPARWGQLSPPGRARWWVAVAVTGLGTRCGCGRARRWICNVGGGKGSRTAVSLALALPAVWGSGRSRGVDAEEEERGRRERGGWQGGRKAGAGTRGVPGTAGAGPKRRCRKVPEEPGEVGQCHPSPPARGRGLAAAARSRCAGSPVAGHAVPAGGNF